MQFRTFLHVRHALEHISACAARCSKSSRPQYSVKKNNNKLLSLNFKTTAPHLAREYLAHIEQSEQDKMKWRQNIYDSAKFQFEAILSSTFGGAGMAQWFAVVRFPDPAPNVGWVCWFSSLHREVFSGYSGFPSPQKPKFDLIVLIVNLSYSAVSLISAPALEKTRHLNKGPYLTVTQINN